MLDIFAKNIKFLRIRDKLTQRELANKLGKDYSTIGKWELGVNIPALPEVIQMAEFFNVDLINFLEKDFKMAEYLNKTYKRFDTIDDDKYPNLKDVYFKTKNGLTLEDMTEEQKQLFNFVVGNLKKNKE